MPHVFLHISTNFKLSTYFFHKLHNLLFSCLTCDEIVNISDNIHADGAGQVILGVAESAHHEAGEQEKFSVHDDETSMTAFDTQLCLIF